MYPDNKGTKLEINNKEIDKKSSDIWRLKNIFVNNKWVKGEVSREILKLF